MIVSRTTGRIMIIGMVTLSRRTRDIAA